jgi:hypothetical protein
VLLARGAAAADQPLVVAGGYQRVCTSYLLDADADIPCQPADLQ